MSTLKDAEKQAIEKDVDASSVSAQSEVSVTKQIALESENAIKYRTCSWQKVRSVQFSGCTHLQTAALLFSEYICLAIMSFPWFVLWFTPCVRDILLGRSRCSEWCLVSS